MWKKLLVIMPGLVLGSILAVQGVWASFSDIETSRQNVFATGSIDLKLADIDEYFGEDPPGGPPNGDSVYATWVMRDAEPGDSVTGSLSARNFGSLKADHLEMRVVNLCSEPTDDSEPENTAEEEILGHPVPMTAGEGIFDIDREMIITLLVYDSKVIIWGEKYSFDPAYVTDLDGDGQISLDELETKTLILPPPDVGSWSLAMTVKFDEDASNEYRSDQVETTFIFTLIK